MYNFRQHINSVHEIVGYLKTNPASTETEILSGVFGFTRSANNNNKKYAYMLRRGIQKGLIGRTAPTYKCQSRFVYSAINA